MSCAMKVYIGICAVLALIGIVWCSPVPAEHFQFSPLVGIWQTRKLPTSTTGSSYKGRRISWIPSSGWAAGPGKKRSLQKVIEMPVGPETHEEDLIQLCNLLEHMFAELTDVSEEVKELNQVCSEFRGNASADAKEPQ
ncbi:uncharacterized protein LOC129582633 [Paramacrobiotus metropolitanus]|uniref:uncharacterized protein LOC129582633 n=1 Tax=Paramacrobiotus metropolitanus TaxID=2943436 RepID=UPI002446079F|nr:uncharacterized protein LOC129582633 [Paramacrobiotus metropolitanus]